jgi:hypothetical protein
LAQRGAADDIRCPSGTRRGGARHESRIAMRSRVRLRARAFTGAYSLELDVRSRMHGSTLHPSAKRVKGLCCGRARVSVIAARLRAQLCRHRRMYATRKAIRGCVCCTAGLRCMPDTVRVVGTRRHARAWLCGHR